jgi:hypothetical protein
MKLAEGVVVILVSWRGVLCGWMMAALDVSPPLDIYVSLPLEMFEASRV